MFLLLKIYAVIYVFISSYPLFSSEMIPFNSTIKLPSTQDLQNLCDDKVVNTPNERHAKNLLEILTPLSKNRINIIHEFKASQGKIYQTNDESMKLYATKEKLWRQDYDYVMKLWLDLKEMVSEENKYTCQQILYLMEYEKAPKDMGDPRRYKKFDFQIAVITKKILSPFHKEVEKTMEEFIHLIDPVLNQGSLKEASFKEMITYFDKCITLYERLIILSQIN